ncbi:response regulator transcription factor [Microbacterium sp. Bi128]|uniref:response regulator transcription factor n=1 Tax=Microbacterium sp. Bi128 TaxID=2821115 RepID=UPI001E120B7E|nr:response regulator transcription factor [Microbacterium sp. Bi128]CAH0295225.1 Alkaline phosphatase synthesis transcriptional regulatory protein PhoP [Microbacterium sp. Bi128]
MLDSPGQLRAVVVEGDDDVRLLICRTLQLQGFAVFEAGSGAEGLLKIQEHRPDLVTLELELPDLDGVEVCRRLRKFSDAYVVMITARSDEIDEVMGLEIGADDFIRKPFSPRSVQARVTAVMRRHRPTAQRPTPRRRATDFMPAALTAPAPGDSAHRDSAHRDSASGTPGAPGAPGAPPRRRASDVGAVPPVSLPASAAAPAASGEQSPESAAPIGSGIRHTDAHGVLRHGPLVVEAEGRVASLHGVELELTRTEFDLLEALAGAPRRVWTRKALLTQVWGNEWPREEHLVEVHVGNLRKKLGDSGREPRFIRTVRGVGYRMAPVEAAANPAGLRGIQDHASAG